MIKDMNVQKIYIYIVSVFHDAYMQLKNPMVTITKQQNTYPYDKKQINECWLTQPPMRYLLAAIEISL